MIRRRWRIRKSGALLWGCGLLVLSLFTVLSFLLPNQEDGIQAHLTDSQSQLDIGDFLKSESAETQRRNGGVRCVSGRAGMAVAVASAPAHFILRDAIRKSWAPDLPGEATLLFHVGVSTDPEVQKELDKEISTHGDIVKGGFIDSYHNLTLKTLSMMNWVRQSCTSSKYLLKVDDDIFINNKKLSKLIECINFADDNMYMKAVLNKPNDSADQKEIPRKKTTDESKINFQNFRQMCQPWNPFDLLSHYIATDTSAYEGYVAAGYVYKKVSPDRNPASKWFLPHKAYPAPAFPSFLSGTSYLLSTKLLPHLLTAAIRAPFVHLEDVFLTGIVASDLLKLRLSRVEGWSNFRPRFFAACSYHRLVTAHGLSAEEMLDVNAVVANTDDDDCTGIANLPSLLNDKISHYFPKYS